MEFRRGPFLPVLERQEEGGEVGFVLAVQQAVAIQADHVLHRRVLAEDLVGLIDHGPRAVQAGAVGQNGHPQQIALILVRHEAAGHALEQPEGDEQQAAEQHQSDQHAPEQEGRTGDIAAGHFVERFIKAAKEDIFLAVRRLEQDRRQRRTEGQRHHAGDDHRNGDGDGELLVQLAGDAAQEGGGNEHRAQHQHDGDHRAGHLVHRPPRRLLGVQTELMHVAFDVFDHHDGVVHHDADGQDHAEQGQGVDREAQHIHAGESADDGHRHRQQGDQRGPPVLQEQVHHQNDQDDRFEEGMHHRLDGDFDELGGVVGNGIADAGGEILGQLLHPGDDLVGDIQGIGAGLLIHHDDIGAFAIQQTFRVVAASAQFDPRHVAQQHGRTIGVGAQDDLLEFLGVRPAGPWRTPAG